MKNKGNKKFFERIILRKSKFLYENSFKDWPIMKKA